MSEPIRADAAPANDRKSAEGADTRNLSAGVVSRLFSTAGVYAIAVFFVILGIVLQLSGAIGNFLSPQNMLNIVDAVALVGIAAVGMAFVTYSGNFADMSFPTTMAVTGYICIELLRYGFAAAIIGALAAGLLIGLLNGLVVGRFKANPIIWTLAVNYVTMGVIRLIWVNKQIYPDMVGSQQHAVSLFDAIYRLRFFNLIGLPLVILAVLVVLGQLILTRTVFGAQLKLTGSSPRAAKLSGIAVERVIILSFVLAAFAATVAGLAITSLSRVGAWYNGAGYDFKAVTAVVLGGMTLAGGRGTIVGVLGGSLIIGIMNNIMTLLGIGTFSQDIIRGAIFIIVVGLNALSLRKLGRDDA